MRKSKYQRTEYNVELMQQDMDEEGWLAADLARKAGTSHVTVHRFFTGKARTARTAKKLADALGQPLRRYIIKPAKSGAAARRAGLAGEERA